MSGPDGAPLGDKLSAQLWHLTKHGAYQSLYCPFVLAMAQGTLPR